MTVAAADTPTVTAPASAVEHVRVAVVGAGFAGLGMAIRLREIGIEDFVVLERAQDLGGTWRDNHYPGCCCDVPSHVYSYSFALDPLWTRGFASQPEILAYLRRTASEHDVLRHVRYGHELLEARWEEAVQRWSVRTSDGTLHADILVLATGPLSDPTVPHLPGLEHFAGTTFHSAQWNHEHDLRGERIAVVGTGASAIQFIPKIQPLAARLTVFQRTPPWLMPRLDHQITPTEHWLLRHIPGAPAVTRALLWSALEARVAGFRHPRVMRAAAGIARVHMRRQVADPALRAKLTPDYTMGCKRILVSDDYYPAVAQPNVEVVTAGIREVRERSVIDMDGVEHAVDTIIFGTGFHVTDAPVAARVHGRDGRSLAQAWGDSFQAYLGTTVTGYPNMFFLLGPNTGLGHNSIIYMIESQLNYIADALRVMGRHCIGAVDVRPEVQQRFNERIDRMTEGTVWVAGHCRSWYLDATGRNSTLWPGWTFSFRRQTRHFRPDRYRLQRRRATAPSPGGAPATTAAAVAAASAPPRGAPRP